MSTAGITAGARASLESRHAARLRIVVCMLLARARALRDTRPCAVRAAVIAASLALPRLFKTHCSPDKAVHASPESNRPGRLRAVVCTPFARVTVNVRLYE